MTDEETKTKQPTDPYDWIKKMDFGFCSHSSTHTRKVSLGFNYSKGVEVCDYCGAYCP